MDKQIHLLGLKICDEEDSVQQIIKFKTEIMFNSHNEVEQSRSQIEQALPGKRVYEITKEKLR